jgi:hypothetical protein
MTIQKNSKLTALKLRSLPWPEALNARGARLTMDETYRVGKLIVDVVYGGNRSSDKSRKTWSLRRLQEQVLENASFATLARCVQTYEACRQLGLKPPLQGVRAGHLLNMTHLNRSEQRRMMDRVGRNGLSVQQLREATGRLQGQGRRRKPGVVRALRALNQQELLEDLDLLDGMQRVEMRRLGKQLTRVQEALTLVQRELKRRSRQA